MHPGVIATELARNNTGAQIFYFLGGLFMKSIPQGAATQALCLVREDLKGVRVSRAPVLSTLCSLGLPSS